MKQPLVEYKLQLVMKGDDLVPDGPVTIRYSMRGVREFLKSSPKNLTYKLSTVITTVIEDPSLYVGGE